MPEFYAAHVDWYELWIVADVREYLHGRAWRLRHSGRP